MVVLGVDYLHHQQAPVFHLTVFLNALRNKVGVKDMNLNLLKCCLSTKRVDSKVMRKPISIFIGKVVHMKRELSS